MNQDESTKDTGALLSLAMELAVQDNAATQDPVYVVQRRVRLYGVDADYTTEFVWIDDDGVEWSDDDKEVAVSDDENEMRGLKKVGIEDVFVADQWFLTRRAAEAYLAAEAHNLGAGARVYVDSAHRNPEVQMLRRWLLAIAHDAREQLAAGFGRTAGEPKQEPEAQP